MGQMQYYVLPSKYHDTCFSGENQIKLVTIINDFMILLDYLKDEDFIESCPNVNVVIAAAVTSQARLKLYSYLEKLQERVLYYDTDSIIYLTRPQDNYEVPTGNFLGEMTDELEDYGPGSFINEYVSIGPKSYAYEVTTTNQNGTMK